MGVERVDSPEDPRVAAYRGIRDGDLLRSSGLFVAEGRHIVRRVVEDGRYSVQSLLVNDAALNGLGPLLDRLDASVPILVAEPKTLSAIAGYDMHRGCLALVHRLPPTPVDVLAETTALLVVLEGVSNADNVGGIFRNAAAFSAGGVLLSPTCCDPLYRKSIRTSMGATLSVPFARAELDDWPRVLTRLSEAGFTLVALTPREPSDSLESFAARPRTTRVALMLGTEGAGLTAAAESAAEYRVRIPITADVDSLNVATAAAIALYELGLHQT